MACRLVLRNLFITFLLSIGCSNQDQPNLPRARPLTDRVFEVTPAKIERGRYLTEGVLQCFLCHSERDWDAPGAPPIAEMKGAGKVVWDDSTYFLAAPNITSDPETGAGKLTDDMLARAIREGIGHDGRALAVMWYWSFRALSDEDVASVVVYLRTIPPVKNLLPKRRLPPDEERYWDRQPQPLIEPVPPREFTDPVERGEYLVDLGDCAGCHTAWEAPRFPGRFGGGNLVGDGATGTLAREEVLSSNLTHDPSGLAYYDDSLFIEVMKTGRVGAREIDPFMPWTAFRNMSDDDLRAVFSYLGTLRHVRHIIDRRVVPTYCEMCGQEHGEGEYNVPKIESVFPLSLDEDEFDRYLGLYREEGKGEESSVIFLREGTSLLATWLGDTARYSRMKVVQGADSFFYTNEWPGYISFIENEDGEVIGMISHEDEDYVMWKE